MREEPYDGSAVLEGTHVESRVRLGLVVPGPLLFAAGYRHRVLVHAPAERRSSARAWSERLAVVPEQTPTYSGLSLVGAF